MTRPYTLRSSYLGKKILLHIKQFAWGTRKKRVEKKIMAFSMIQNVWSDATTQKRSTTAPPKNDVPTAFQTRKDTALTTARSQIAPNKVKLHRRRRKRSSDWALSSQWWWLFVGLVALVLFIMLCQICSKLNRVHRLMRLLVMSNPDLSKMMHLRF